MTLHLTRQQGLAITYYITGLCQAGRLPDLMQIEQDKSSPRINPPVAVKVLNGNNRILHEGIFNSAGGRVK